MFKKQQQMKSELNGPILPWETITVISQESPPKPNPPTHPHHSYKAPTLRLYVDAQAASARAGSTDSRRSLPEEEGERKQRSRAELWEEDDVTGGPKTEAHWTTTRTEKRETNKKKEKHNWIISGADLEIRAAGYAARTVTHDSVSLR